MGLVRFRRLLCAGNWNPAFRTTTVLPMRILLLRPATHLHLIPHDAASRNPLRGRAFGVLLLRVKASLSEFDLRVRRASRFSMLRPAFRDAPNGEGREYLIAGSLQ